MTKDDLIEALKEINIKVIRVSDGLGQLHDGKEYLGFFIKEDLIETTSRNPASVMFSFRDCKIRMFANEDGFDAVSLQLKNQNHTCGTFLIFHKNT